jgi:sugar phosphate isomerase/epimerase
MKQYPLNRRKFVAGLGAVAAGATTLPGAVFGKTTQVNKLENQDAELPFKISVAEWSLHREIRNKKSMTNMDFPRVAREEFEIDAIEYVNQFFKDKANNLRYLTDLKMQCDDHGVQSLLIMIDGEGRLGDPDKAARAKAVENHHKWVVAAKFLGCHSIRVNAGSGGTYDEQIKLAADGLRSLSEFASLYGLNVIVENHGGLSSNGEWLSSVIKTVELENCGTLPDFGNFNLGGGKTYDRYKGVTELMPFAKAVSAKSHEFDDEGNEVRTDYMKMMKIVLDAGYRGYVGIEWEGGGMSEFDGVRKTKELLQRCQKELA